MGKNQKEEGFKKQAGRGMVLEEISWLRAWSSPYPDCMRPLPTV